LRSLSAEGRNVAKAALGLFPSFQLTYPNPSCPPSSRSRRTSLVAARTSESPVATRPFLPGHEFQPMAFVTQSATSNSARHDTSSPLMTSMTNDSIDARHGSSRSSSLSCSNYRAVPRHRPRRPRTHHPRRPAVAPHRCRALSCYRRRTSDRPSPPHHRDWRRSSQERTCLRPIDAQTPPMTRCRKSLPRNISPSRKRRCKVS